MPILKKNKIGVQIIKKPYDKISNDDLIRERKKQLNYLNKETHKDFYNKMMSIVSDKDEL